MNINPLIFSNQRGYRLARHSLFWVGWIVYYSIYAGLGMMSSYSFAKGFFASLLEVTVSTPLDMAFCYSIIYFLLPQFLFKGRYVSMALLWLLFSIMFMVAFESYVWYILPTLRGWYGMPAPKRPENFTWVFFNLFAQINMEGCLAASIKLGKLWHIKQQELDLIKNERKKIEPLIDEGQIQPVFFADILNRIEILADEKPMVAAAVIKKIKALLLYAMYENNQPRVSLAKEFELLDEYVELEKIALEGKVNITLTISGNAQQEQVAPFIILPLAENAFKQLSLHTLKAKALDIDVKIAGGVLSTTVCWSKPADTSTLYTGRGIVLQNVSKRLSLIYPHSHELKVYINVDDVVVNLKINLRKAINK